MDTNQIIILVGYMGSGKTAVGQNLGEYLDCKFVDLDAYIVQNQNLSISEIFDQKGPIYFRKKEHETLLELLEMSDNTIISLGGGTPCYYNHMELFHTLDHATTVYLNVSIPILVERLYPEMDKRPLISALNSKEELTEFIGKHLFERRPFYSRSKIKIDVLSALTTIDDITKEVVAQLF